MKRTFQEIVDIYYWYSLRKCYVHYDMAEKNKNHHRVLGVVVVFVTAVVGTSVFTSLGQKHDLWIQVGTGLLSVAAVVLSALQTFLGFSDLQVQHKTAAARYGTCRRDLELLTMKFPNATGVSGVSGTAELEAIKMNLDDLDRESPTIPDRAWDAVVKKNPIE